MMIPVIRSVSAALVIVAMAAPSFGEPLSAEREEAKVRSRMSTIVLETATVDRQQRDWVRLSASICSGCITSANRVAPMNFEREKPVNATVAAQPVTQATAEQVRSAATPRKLAQSKKRYARIQRRDRHKLALRARQLRIAALLKRRQLRAAALRRHMQRPVAATTAPAVVPAYALGNEMRVYRIPVDLPAAPVHDSRWRETILPTANSNRLRRT